MPFTTVNGTKLHYERSGSGEPLLLITGFAISAAVFEPVLPSYAGRFDVVTYDNRGSGRSGTPLTPSSMPQFAGDAVRLLDALHIDSAHVYGLSMGGMVAQEMAIRFPDRVRGLVLGGTSPGGPRAVLPASKELSALGMAFSGAPRGVQARVVAAAVFSEEFRSSHPDEAARLLRYFGKHRGTAVGANWHWWASVFHDTVARLPKIQAPTLVMHGECDGLCPLGNADILVERIPDAELCVIPGAGHAYLLEQPAESFRLFADWVDRRSPIRAGRRLTGVAARTEPVTRMLGLPVGSFRTGRSLLARAAGTRRSRTARGARSSTLPTGGHT